MRRTPDRDCRDDRCRRHLDRPASNRTDRGAHRIEIRVQEYPLLKAQALVGARILARGVCTPSPKHEAKVADLRLLVPDSQS